MSDQEKRNAPSEDQIRARAYEIYLQRGGEEGNHQDDWLAAERELTLEAESQRATQPWADEARAMSAAAGAGASGGPGASHTDSAVASAAAGGRTPLHTSRDTDS